MVANSSVGSIGIDGTDRTPVVLGTKGSETSRDGDTPMPGPNVSETGKPVGMEPGRLIGNVEFSEMKFAPETRRFRADTEAVALIEAIIRKSETGRWLGTW